jgi:hypothetical protein
MTFLRACIVAVLVALPGTIHAFTPAKRGSMGPASFSKSFHVLRLSDEKPSKGESTFVSSVLKKEIVYDEKTGRFFETGFGEGECVPEEEFCLMDKESGESIRLTVEEKERIFLDALQVSRRP